MFLIIILLLFGFAPEQIPCSSRETLRFLGNKIHCSPQDQSLSVDYLMPRALTVYLKRGRLLEKGTRLGAGY